MRYADTALVWALSDQTLNCWGKERKLRGRGGGGEILKVKTKILAIWGILGANLKKCSTLKIHYKYQFCTFNLNSQIHHLNFHGEKKYACRFFSAENIFFCDVRFSFAQESSFPRWIPELCRFKVYGTRAKVQETEFGLEGGMQRGREEGGTGIEGGFGCGCTWLWCVVNKYDNWIRKEQCAKMWLLLAKYMSHSLKVGATWLYFMSCE